jgi:cation-transporting ATPase 13A1
VVKNVTREVIERDLHFAGFLIFDCPLKPDSKSTIELLTNSSHKIAMITGDNTLTACKVAQDLTITTKPQVILNPERLIWYTIDEKTEIPYDPKKLSSLSEKYDFCLSGDALTILEARSQLHEVIPFVSVFARASPEQKVLIFDF